jgi:hypothetical protein
MRAKLGWLVPAVIAALAGGNCASAAVQAGPAVQHSSNLELDDVTTREPLKATPVIRLEDTPDAIVRNSRAFKGTDVFLSTGKGELKNIVLEGNALREAGVPTQESENGNNAQ